MINATKREPGIGRGEPPLHGSPDFTTGFCPCVSLAAYALSIRQTPIQTLASQDGELDLCHVQPTAMLRRSVKRQRHVSAVGLPLVEKSGTAQLGYGCSGCPAPLESPLPPGRRHPPAISFGGRRASSRDIFGCSKNRQNRIVENSTYPLDDFGFR